MAQPKMTKHELLKISEQIEKIYQDNNIAGSYTVVGNGAFSSNVCLYLKETIFDQDQDNRLMKVTVTADPLGFPPPEDLEPSVISITMIMIIQAMETKNIQYINGVLSGLEKMFNKTFFGAVIDKAGKRVMENFEL